MAKGVEIQPVRITEQGLPLLTESKTMDPGDERNTASLSRDLRQEVVNGLLYAPSRLNANAGKTLETASFLYTLVELLSEKVFA